MMDVRIIKVILPEKEEIEHLESVGIDVEAEYTQGFIQELKERLKQIRNGK